MRTAAVLVVVLVILAGAMQGWARLREARLDARALARESSQRALLPEIQTLLAEYDETHGEYPATLTGLALTYPDGGTSELLQDIEYRTTPDGYVLRTKGCHSGQVLDCSEPVSSSDLSKPRQPEKRKPY